MKTALEVVMQSKTDSRRALRVFLCHSSSDKPAIRDLSQRLKEANIDPWLDEEKLLPGQDWNQEITKAVRAADAVIVCLSRGSISKAGYVQKEIKYALDIADEQPEGTIFLIPLKLEECEIPERLRRWQWVNCFDEDGYKRLMDALRIRAQNLGAKAPPELPLSQVLKKYEGQRIKAKGNHRKGLFFALIGVLLAAGGIGAWLAIRPAAMPVLPSPTLAVIPTVRPVIVPTFTETPVVPTSTIRPTATPTPTSGSPMLTPAPSGPARITVTNAERIVLLHTFDGQQAVQGVAFSPDGWRLAAGTHDAVRIWRMADRTLWNTLTTDPPVPMTRLAFSPDGATLASGTDARFAVLWGTSGGNQRILKGNPGVVREVVFSPDGQVVISASEDHTVRLWRVTDGTELRVLEGHGDNPVMSIALSPDGKILASGAWDDTVRLWRVSDGTPILSLSARVWGLAFSPDGTILATGEDFKSIRLWRVSDGTLLRTLTGHTQSVAGVAFSPDGSILASASYDKTVRLWRVSDGTLLRTFEGHTAPVWSVTFSPDGTVLASGSWDKTVRLWGVPES